MAVTAISAKRAKASASPFQTQPYFCALPLLYLAAFIFGSLYI
jgi:hypothetical protein